MLRERKPFAVAQSRAVKSVLMISRRTPPPARPAEISLRSLTPELSTSRRRRSRVTFPRLRQAPPPRFGHLLIASRARSRDDARLDPDDLVLSNKREKRFPFDTNEEERCGVERKRERERRGYYNFRASQSHHCVRHRQRCARIWLSAGEIHHCSFNRFMYTGCGDNDGASSADEARFFAQE